MSAQSDTDRPLERLIALMKLTTASIDGEALAAIRAANRHLAAHFGGDWDLLLRGKVKVTVMADPFANAAVPKSRNAAPPPPPAAAQPAPSKPQPQPASASPPPRPSYGGRGQSAVQGRLNRFAGVCHKCGKFNAAGTATLGTNAAGEWKIECLPGSCQTKAQQRAQRPTSAQLKDALGF